MGVELVAASLASGVVLARWRRALPAERLLVLWLLVGFLELVAHDAGNERRYVMLVPALIALSAVLVGRVGAMQVPADGRLRWLALPVATFLCYMVVGTCVRLAFLPDVVAGQLKGAVRIATPLAAVCGVLIVWQWRRLADWVSRDAWPAAAVALLVAIVVVGNLVQYAQWAMHRTDLNYKASVLVGRLLPPETLVHGKLANGLSLENRIKPIFVGHGFGNYDDRTVRDDVRYVLTYVSPYVGYEGRVIRDVLAAYPHRSIVARFEVAETGSGDRAVLVDKFGAPGGAAPEPAIPARTGPSE
jgi:hypothetical protein